MAKSPKHAPPPSAKTKAHRAKRRHILLLTRQAVQQDKAERSERHKGIKRQPREGGSRTRRASRR